MTTWGKPLCDDCLRAAGDIPVAYCALCESAVMLTNSPIQKADKFGVHYTKTGGYAGKCYALPTTGQ
jgi:hypothetical protein